MSLVSPNNRVGLRIATHIGSFACLPPLSLTLHLPPWISMKTCQLSRRPNQVQRLPITLGNMGSGRLSFTLHLSLGHMVADAGFGEDVPGIVGVVPELAAQVLDG